MKNNNLDWNDSIEVEVNEYLLLPEADYNFIVSDFKREKTPGSIKFPPCNKAILQLQVKHQNQVVTVYTELILNRVFEFRISSFFRSIGLKKRGKKYIMDWSKVVGAEGYAHFKPRIYIGADHTVHKVNDVEFFIDKENYYDAINDNELTFNQRSSAKK